MKQKLCFFLGDITRSGGTERVASQIANALAGDGAYDVCLLRLVERIMDGSSNYELVASDQLVGAAGTYNSPKTGSPYDEQSKEFSGKNKKGEE